MGYTEGPVLALYIIQGMFRRSVWGNKESY